MRSSVLGTLVFLLGISTVAAAEVSPKAIVLPDGASPSQKRGAAELQSHLKQMTGTELPVVAAPVPLPEDAIVIGDAGQLKKLGIDVAVEDVGEEGFHLKTIGRRVVVCGSSVRGGMYGCTALLEKLGVRWLTPAITVVPEAKDPKLPTLDETQTPAFEYREPFFTEAFDKNWAARLRVNGNSAALDESTGGKVRYHPFAHSFDTLIPRSLFEQHPEYFPVIKGKRTNGYVQRCLSNPEVLKIATDGVRGWIKADPGAKLYSVTQNDTYNFCECEKCTEIANQYGGQSGLYLWFVNQIADVIAKEYPDKVIDTFAYQFTQPTPKDIAPRPNVRVRLCPIAACASHPFEQCTAKQSQEFMQALRGWSAITKTLYIWHYNTDFGAYLLPFPDFDEFTADIRLYQRIGVRGLFLEGAYGPGGGGSDAELRSYVMAKMAWDPAVNTDDLVTEWMNGVYRAASKPMRAWFDLMHEKVRRPDKHLFIYTRPADAWYLDDDTLAQGDRLFDEAEKLAAGDAKPTQYLAKSRLWLRFTKLTRHPADGPDLDRFVADVKAAGIKQLREGGTVEAWEQQYRNAVRNLSKGKK